MRSVSSPAASPSRARLPHSARGALAATARLSLSLTHTDGCVCARDACVCAHLQVRHHHSPTTPYVTSPVCLLLRRQDGAQVCSCVPHARRARGHTRGPAGARGREGRLEGPSLHLQPRSEVPPRRAAGRVSPLAARRAHGPSLRPRARPPRGHACARACEMRPCVW